MFPSKLKTLMMCPQTAIQQAPGHSPAGLTQQKPHLTRAAFSEWELSRISHTGLFPSILFGQRPFGLEIIVRGNNFETTETHSH